MSEIKILRGDITLLNVDAIVNAANKSLLGGGGVDGAIHRAAGRQLLEACLKLNGCETGDAKITAGFELPARHVIHTVGPVWYSGRQNRSALLASCYRRCLEIAQQYNLKSMAFPNISTGIYGYPKREAATIAIGEVKKFLANNALPETVIFCIFNSENYEIYAELVRS
ncbi:MAG: O-acetyl-ADP-ribose deacetylase [Prolixibacteraceae bacterium]|nr:O-acetyl-ADP-ribose deacetylase [Prolixibacteraceae bacterium]